MYRLLKKIELYLPRGIRIGVRIDREEKSNELPHWMYRLCDITGYKERMPLPPHYYYLSDIINGNHEPNKDESLKQKL